MNPLRRLRLHPQRGRLLVSWLSLSVLHPSWGALVLVLTDQLDVRLVVQGVTQAAQHRA